MTPKVVFWPPHMCTYTHTCVCTRVHTHTTNSLKNKMMFQAGQIPKQPVSSSATGAEKQLSSSQGSSGIQQHTFPYSLHSNKGKGHQPFEIFLRTSWEGRQLLPAVRGREPDSKNYSGRPKRSNLETTMLGPTVTSTLYFLHVPRSSASCGGEGPVTNGSHHSPARMRDVFKAT